MIYGQEADCERVGKGVWDRIACRKKKELGKKRKRWRRVNREGEGVREIEGENRVWEGGKK